ncbi:hypothetical protein Dsin_010795 [Dipteronia sinensis]|uniref:Reverse transcriptase domain-containing protein n=1 Tax=Dipteronia sinensis TaxID=43782 RepID=A0AAE0AU54_9ROSI|nr:hypothetical protein Dsin_010795 [Dipteronia sinensis]
MLNGEASIRNFNKTNVVLILKKKNPMNMKDFRPISLCSVVYKIVTTAMTNRLRGFLPKIISPNQSAFVSRRLIFDNVLIAFELLHSIGKRKKGKKSFIALKIDMSKAYDRVEWGFLECVMLTMGFPSRCIDLVLDCISTSTIGFVIIGKVSGEVVPSRGLRGSPLVSHLFFADASVLFYKTEMESCKEISRVLKVYEKGFEQMVNLQKSNITFSLNVGSSVRADIQAVFGVGNAQTHDKYLGLPTLVGKNKKKTFNDIKESVWRKLRGWKGDLFSLGGKEMLIKAVIQVMPTYTISISQIPLGLCKKLGAMISKFLWGSKDGSKSLAFKLLKAKYFRNGDFLSVDLKPGASHVWRNTVEGWTSSKKGSDGRLATEKALKLLLIPGSLEHPLLDLLLVRILSIPLGMRRAADKLLWHYDKKGTFEVKSGYRIAIQEKIIEACSNHSKSQR